MTMDNRETGFGGGPQYNRTKRPPMTPSDFQRLEKLFEEAVSLPAEQWPRFLDAHCGEEPHLREALERMLRASSAESVLTNAVASALEQASGTESELAGERLGGYRVLGHLASGGMAHVYRGERADDEFQKQVAIKVIQSGLGTDGFELRFRQERQILASLDHPNCCRLLDGGMTAEGRPYLVMELIDGETITSYATARKLDLRQRLALFRQLCAAVEYVHSNLIVHRDIKPANVLVTANGAVKLMDFGIAKLLGGSAQSGAGELTTSVDRLATPAYGSPEQLRGEAITTASDVYSMGVLLEELLTGNKRQGDTVASSLPEELRAVLMRATHEEPGRRYQSAGQFSEDIGRYLDGYPVLARPDSWTYRAMKFVRRNRVATAASCLAVAALVGGLLLTMREQRRTKQRFDEVRNLATVFLFEFDNLVSDLPGSTEARRRLVQRALTSLEALSRDAQNDASLQTDIARAYRKVAAIQYMNGRPHLGDRQGAIASIEKELAIRDALARRSPGDVKNRTEIAGAYGFISAALDGVDPKRVKEMDARSGAILDQLEKEFPQHPGVLLQVGAHYTRLGLTLHKEGKLKESLEAELRAIGLLERVRAVKPDHVEGLRFLGWSHIYAGDVLGGGGSEVHLGDRKGAIAEMIRGKEVFQDSLKRNPTSGLAVRDIFSADGRIAGTYDMMGEFDKAIAIRRDVVAHAEARMQRDRNNAEAARDSAVEHSAFGLTLIKAGKLDEAERELQRSAEIDHDRIKRFPQDVRAAVDLASVEHNMGDLLAKRKRFAPAAEHLRQAIALRLDSLKKNPNDQRLLWRQAKTYQRLGEVLSDGGDQAGARAALTEALQQLESVNSNRKVSAEDTAAMAEIRKRLGVRN